MLRVLLAALLGAIVLFVWGFLAWVVLPLHTATVRALPDEAAVTSALDEIDVDPGAYMFPMPASVEGMDQAAKDAATEQWKGTHRRGPVGMIIIAEGREPMAPATFATGFAHCFVSALLASTLLFVAAPALRSYWGRLLFVGALGLLVGVVADLSYWNWLYFPTDYSLMMVVDRVIGWLLAGLVIAAVVKAPVVARVPPPRASS